ncbi:hypothetical protein RRG08_021841 [Elysia crispata]|uniref:Uncharacterized protein n=1 Tax=Elysia crispata TaxID=231223 RepID=A0AAE0ZZD9_9GAST|nr:hypothetical protein RRG08_021841 [Elysia crispata]
MESYRRMEDDEDTGRTIESTVTGSDNLNITNKITITDSERYKQDRRGRAILWLLFFIGSLAFIIIAGAVVKIVYFESPNIRYIEELRSFNGTGT